MRVLHIRVACLVALAFLAGLLLSLKSYGAEKDEILRSVFDAEYYYNENPDLQEQIGHDPEALFAHFVNAGLREGRAGSEQFSIKAYVRYNPELLDVYKTDWASYCGHYILAGKAEGRRCLPQPEEDPLIGFYHTDYDKTLPRASNIALAAARINGIVLQPGEPFSFSEAVLPRTPENGYVLAPAIGGMEYGGGICQVSSTLYAAMCHAMLPATERYPHSSRISYMPVGLDATISEGRKDLKFINPYKRPLTILARTDETGITVSLFLGAGDAGESVESEHTKPEETASESEEAFTEKKEMPPKTGDALTVEDETLPETERPLKSLLLESGQVPVEKTAAPEDEAP
ncbi:MAG: VanW family protein [Lachnospiraceae bacterium]|nr:VanW family protein [Lachnospiraceae bacterium]